MPISFERPTCLCARVDWCVASTGQLNSLLLALSGLAAGFVAQLGYHVPNYSAASIYLLLATYALYFLRVRQRAGGRFRLEAPAYVYLFAAFVDAEANFLLVKALQLTSFASVMVLDCATVPWCMLLSRIFLKARYRPLHVAGAACSLLGVVLLVLADLRSPSSATAPAPLLGDLLSVGSSFLFAVSSVLQEALCTRSPLGGRRRGPLPVARADKPRRPPPDGPAERARGGVFVPRAQPLVQAGPVPPLPSLSPPQEGGGEAGGGPAYPSVEYLAMLGALGAAIAGCQAALAGETPHLRRLARDPRASGGFLAYAVCLWGAYSLGCLMVVRSSAAFLTLSFLTSDIYSIIAGAMFFGNRFSPLYICSLAITLGGLVVYLLSSAAPPPPSEGGYAAVAAEEEVEGDPWEEPV